MKIELIKHLEMSRELKKIERVIMNHTEKSFSKKRFKMLNYLSKIRSDMKELAFLEHSVEQYNKIDLTKIYYDVESNMNLTIEEWFKKLKYKEM